MDAIQRRQCGHKLKYSDMDEATRAAKAMHKKHKAPFAPYQCRWCHHFHIGTVRSGEAAVRRSERRLA